MDTFKCRSIVPNRIDWLEVKAESAGLAANEYHSRAFVDQATLKWRLEDGTYVHFALIEVENGGEFIARRFTRGITRAGRKSSITLEDIAKQLGWFGDPQELINPGWEGEEDSWSSPGTTESPSSKSKIDESTFPQATTESQVVPWSGISKTYSE